MTEIKLTDFTCQPHYPYTLFLGSSVETGGKLMGIFEPIPIKVPESIYTALERAGIIENPLVKMNSLKAEWVPERWWLYETRFAGSDEKNCELVFESVDYHCHIYLNGEKIAEHIGASMGFTVDISGKVQKENLLRIIVENVPNENGQIGHTNRTFTQRPRFDNKWDFCTRLKNIGIYRPVTLRFYDDAKINHISFRTSDYIKRRCKISAFADVKKAGEYTFCVSVWDKDERLYDLQKHAVCNEGINKFDFELVAEKMKLWQPNGVGQPYVYRLECKILNQNGVMCDINSQTVGIREIKLEKNEGADFDCLGYTFTVNGQKIFARGFNVTPLKQLLGDETEEDYRNLLAAAKEANANIIRVWGGGVIEQPIFYKLCSEYGLMVWQDMIQSSSGLNSEPSQLPEFMKLLGETVDFTLCHRAQYPCLAVVCGGNELFGADGKPVSFGNENIDFIYGKVAEYAPDLAFIPSTASGPTQDASLSDPTQNHDIHGPWAYMGNETHYRHFNKLKTLFVGEFGCNGMCSLSSAEKFIDKKNLIVTHTTENDEWRHHGEWWDNGGWVRELYGESIDLSELNTVSRYLQSVGLGYAINSLRRAAPYTSGLMVWQLNEMYPSLFLTSLIDYYGEKKPAYYAAKRAFADVVPSFAYDKMAFNANEEFCVEMFVTFDYGKVPYKVFLSEDNGKNVKVSEIRNGISESGTHKICARKYSLEKGYLRLTLRCEANGRDYENEVLFLCREDKYCNKNTIKIMEDINEKLQ